MNCNICDYKINRSIFNAKILNKYDVKYYYCKHCGFLQTEAPYWLDEAYNESINISDTGIISRNLNLSKITTLISYFFFDKDKKFLDFAGGYGIFTRLMRDIGFDFYWDDKFSKNLISRGFEYKKDEGGGIEMITSFEAFEHFDNPIKEIKDMLKISKNILFSTELLPEKIHKPEDWWYYGLEHGQHISFYSLKTLKFIADKYKLNIYTNGTTIHLLTAKKINKYLFKLILKLKRFGLFNILSKNLNSKTVVDMNTIIQRLNR